jgi:2-polyprenyl-3-methyl-5-hydroxy-6-metoxy-1,4-benzoquinol methylase
MQPPQVEHGRRSGQQNAYGRSQTLLSISDLPSTNISNIRGNSLTDLTRVENHYEFGANWKDYLRHIDESAIEAAMAGLLRLIPEQKLRGASFLDIGCGSGLHSLAALRLGASRVVAVDIDTDSVEATRQTLQRFAPGAASAVLEMSSLDLDSERLGQFDVVYSWGVLHHTGSMWRAVDVASSLVKMGGLFSIALYQKTPLCGLWRVEKRIYTRLPRPLRAAVRTAFLLPLLLGVTLKRGNPRKFIREYKTRGMNFYTDLEDWLGGYPYESATPEEILEKFHSLGFDPVCELPLPKKLGLFGTGCAEFTFQRRREHPAVS